MSALFLTLMVLSSAPAEGTQTSSTGGLGVARLRFERGLGLYKQGQYKEALAAFREAEQIRPSLRLSYDLARCLEQLADWPGAIAEYQKVARGTQDPHEKAEAEEKIRFLRTHLPASQRSEAQAKAHVASATSAYQRADYDTAIAEWRAALELTPRAAFGLGLARVYERAKKNAAALEAYRSAQKLGPSPAERTELEARIRWLEDALRAEWPELAVRSKPEGALVFLDDRRTGQLGKTNLRQKVAPGKHQLWVDLDGYQAVKKDILASEGPALELELELVPIEHVGRLGFQINVDDAEIYVDGEIIGFSPYHGMRALAAGEHDVRVQAPGFGAFRKTVQVEAERDSKVEVQFKLWTEESVEAEVEGLDEELDGPRGPSGPVRWDRTMIVTGGLVAVLGVVAPIFIQKFALSSDQNPNPQQGAVDTLHTIQIGSAIGAGVLLIGGAVLYFSGALDH